MDPRVLGEVGAVGEGLVAGCTLVWFGFPHVYLCVELEVRFAGEYLNRM